MTIMNWSPIKVRKITTITVIYGNHFIKLFTHFMSPFSFYILQKHEEKKWQKPGHHEEFHFMKALPKMALTYKLLEYCKTLNCCFFNKSTSTAYLKTSISGGNRAP